MHNARLLLPHRADGIKESCAVLVIVVVRIILLSISL